MNKHIWEELVGHGPIVATAIHNGDRVREDLLKQCVLTASDRLREEDPFTLYWTAIAPTRVIGLHSRFEVDLNRPRDKAVYRTPEDAWGLQVWKNELPESSVEESLARYDAFYARLKEILDAKVAEHGSFVVFDLHTYNHRRQGPDGPHAEADRNPHVNIGTGTMNRLRWATLVDRFIADLRSFDFPGGVLDVRENVKFQGGNLSRWVHDNYPETGCTLSIEFKKFFMDEWTGQPDPMYVEAIGSSLHWTLQGVLESLEIIKMGAVGFVSGTNC